MRHLIPTLLLAVAVCVPCTAAAQEPRTYRDVPVSVDCPAPPIPVPGDDGRRYVVYELHIANWSFTDLTLDEVVVRDSTSGASLAHYRPADLSRRNRFRVPLTPQPAAEADLRRIPSGYFGVVFVGLAMGSGDPLPSAFDHRLVFAANPAIRLLRSSAVEGDGRLALDGVRVQVSAERPVRIGPPLDGGDWKCSGATNNEVLHQHQTSLVVQEGRARIPERFAIDFQKVDASGNILPNPFPNEISNSMFYGYGSEVLAVADGVVAKVVDRVPENVPQADGSIKPAAPFDWETSPGNWVSLRIAPDRFAFYAHLQPGSIRVKAGDRVRRGQVIGLVGNSGNSVGPHLHFHVGDANSLNGCEGVPFVIDRFDIVRRPGSAAAGPTVSASIPILDTVVRFGERRARPRSL